MITWFFEGFPTPKKREAPQRGELVKSGWDDLSNTLFSSLTLNLWIFPKGFFFFFLRRVRSCCSPNVYVILQFIRWNLNLPGDGSKRWGIQEAIRSWGWSSLAWDHCPYKRGCRELVCPFHHVRTQQEGTVYGTGQGPHRHQICWWLDLGLPAHRTVRKTFLLFMLPSLRYFVTTAQLDIPIITCFMFLFVICSLILQFMVSYFLLICYTFSKLFKICLCKKHSATWYMFRFFSLKCFT